MLVGFSDALEQQVLTIAQRVTNHQSDSLYYVKYYDNYLHDVDTTTSMPYIVVTVRDNSPDVDPGVGANQTPRKWTVHIYYLDIDPLYATGKARRNAVVERLTAEFDRNFNLDNFSLTDSQGHREYVWNSGVTSVLFDYSGQENYYTFVSEVYLTVQTDRN